MTEQATTTEVTNTNTTESELDQAKRRIKKLRKKHRGGLAPYLVHECRVPLDQLNLTPEELTEVAELKVKLEQWKREAEERVRQEMARRKAMVEESAAKAKQAVADQIVPADAALFDALNTNGVCFVRLSFEPCNRGWVWGCRRSCSPDKKPRRQNQVGHNNQTAGGNNKGRREVRAVAFGPRPSCGFLDSPPR